MSMIVKADLTASMIIVKGRVTALNILVSKLASPAATNNPSNGKTNIFLIPVTILPKTLFFKKSKISVKLVRTPATSFARGPSLVAVSKLLNRVLKKSVKASMVLPILVSTLSNFVSANIFLNESAKPLKKPIVNAAIPARIIPILLSGFAGPDGASGAACAGPFSRKASSNFKFCSCIILTIPLMVLFKRSTA